MDLRAIYLAGMEMAEPAQRQAFIDEACGSNAALRHQVESLFRAADRPADPHTPPLLDTPRELGRLGPFRLLEVLGQGGMGMVYLAEDEQLGRKVAVKVLLPMVAVSPTARQRFLNEAKAAAGLDSDHVVPVYSVGEDRGVPYLVMPFLKGESLDKWLAQGRQCTLPQLLQWGQQVARGLAAAHAKGLVHRDVKPGNIWLEACNGRARLLDFGLARAMESSSDLTQSGLVVGTPGYLAPEQARGEKVDDRSDLFSLGAVLYRLGTGQMPFQGATATAMLTALALVAPKPIAELNASLPRDLADLVMQMLAKDPARRPGSAREVLERLMAIEQARPAPTPAPRTADASGDGHEYDTDPAGRWISPPPPASSPKPRPRKRWLWIAAAAVPAVALLAGLAAMATRPGTLVVNVPEPGVQLFIDGKPRESLTSTTSARLLVSPGLHTVAVKRGEEELFTAPYDQVPGGEVVIDATWLTRRFTNRLGMEFALVPKGKAWLGGRGGQPGDREVSFPDDFYLGVYEVTQEEWEKVMGRPNEHGHFTRTGKQRDDVKHVPDADLRRFPVDTISWNDCQEFLVRLNEKAKDAGWAYRLPRQAEWEYACRGGPLPNKEDYGFDFYLDRPTNALLPERANFNGGGLKRTCKVGSYPPNRLGLYDMHGNVFEICEDSQIDGKGEPLVPLMGGGWLDPGHFCKAFDPGRGSPAARFNGSGLRVARVRLGQGEK